MIRICEPLVGSIARAIPDIERLEAPGEVAAVTNSGPDALLVGEAFVWFSTRPEQLGIRQKVRGSIIGDAPACDGKLHLEPVSDAYCRRVGLVGRVIEVAPFEPEQIAQDEPSLRLPLL